jgi:hypothetical protein
MRVALVFVALTASVAHAATAQPALTPGTYTNEEEVYFDKEAKRTSAPWVGLQVDDTHRMRAIDMFGKAAPAIKAAFVQAVDGALTMTLPDGRRSVLRRARPVTCWGSVPKLQKKPDGSEDWHFVPNLKIHDQGGRVQYGGTEFGTVPVVLRMRNVIWPTGTNKPSVVLYVHTPDNPDHAVAYAWADPGAKRVGINLRWMQASCTIDDK